MGKVELRHGGASSINNGKELLEVILRCIIEKNSIIEYYCNPGFMFAKM